MNLVRMQPAASLNNNTDASSLCSAYPLSVVFLTKMHCNLTSNCIMIKSAVIAVDSSHDIRAQKNSGTLDAGLSTLTRKSLRSQLRQRSWWNSYRITAIEKAIGEFSVAPCTWRHLVQSWQVPRTVVSRYLCWIINKLSCEYKYRPLISRPQQCSTASHARNLIALFPYMPYFHVPANLE